MSEIESVNPETPEVADSATSDAEQFIDPIFKQQNPDRLADELDAPATSEPASENYEGEPSKEALDALIAADKEAGSGDDAEDGDQAEEAEPAKPAKAADADAEEAEAAAKAAEAKKTKANAEEADDDESETPEAEQAAGDDKPDKATKNRRARQKERRERRKRERALKQRVGDLEGQVRTLTEAAAGESPATDTDAETPAAEAAPATETPAEEAPAPTLADHDYNTEKWAAALTEWTERRINRAEEAKEAERRQQHVDNFKALQDKARDKYEDYDDLVYDEVKTYIPEPAALYIESENGAEVAYYLATHQDEARKMAGMNPIAVAREIGRIEATLTAEQAQPATDAGDENSETPAEEADPGNRADEAEEAPAPNPPQQRQTATQAPEPIRPLGGGGSSPGRDPGKLGMDDYAAGRRTGKIK